MTATPSASWQARWVVRAIQVILRLLPWQERHRLARRARRLFEAPNPLTGCARAGCGSGESRRRNPGPRDRGVILYFDGGGYVGGSPVTDRPIPAALARLAERRVFALDYRLAPEHPFPAALDDAVAGYRWPLERGVRPDSLALAGDSAGGELLCLRSAEF